MSAGSGTPRHGRGSPPSNGTGGTGGNPAQASLFLLEPIADAAMTYFYGQLFAMDSEIRAMFPAAMDVQRKRFFRAWSASPATRTTRRYSGPTTRPDIAVLTVAPEQPLSYRPGQYVSVCARPRAAP